MKKQIQEWRASTAPNQEWLIVLIAPPDTTVGSKKRFQMKGSVMDKLRADFNTDKRDRCAYLPWSDHTEDPTLWADFTSRMKEGVVSSIDIFVTAREDDLRKLESLRQNPEWDFGAFCKSKVGTPLLVLAAVG